GPGLSGAGRPLPTDLAQERPMPVRLLVPTSLVGALVLGLLVFGQGPARDKLPPDLALVPGRAVGVLSIRLGEGLADAHAPAGLAMLGQPGLPDALYKDFRVAPSEIERLTLVLVTGEPLVTIVRTRGPLDRKAILEGWSRRHRGRGKKGEKVPDGP